MRDQEAFAVAPSVRANILETHGIRDSDLSRGVSSLSFADPTTAIELAIAEAFGAALASTESEHESDACRAPSPSDLRASILEMHGMADAPMSLLPSDRGQRAGPATMVEVQIAEAFGAALDAVQLSNVSDLPAGHRGGRAVLGLLEALKEAADGGHGAGRARLLEAMSAGGASVVLGSSSGGEEELDAATGCAHGGGLSSDDARAGVAVSLQQVMESVGVSRLELCKLLAQMEGEDEREIEMTGLLMAVTQDSSRQQPIETAVLRAFGAAMQQASTLLTQGATLLGESVLGEGAHHGGAGDRAHPDAALHRAFGAVPPGMAGAGATDAADGPSSDAAADGDGASRSGRGNRRGGSRRHGSRNGSRNGSPRRGERRPSAPSAAPEDAVPVGVPVGDAREGTRASRRRTSRERFAGGGSAEGSHGSNGSRHGSPGRRLTSPSRRARRPSLGAQPAGPSSHSPGRANAEAAAEVAAEAAYECFSSDCELDEGRSDYEGRSSDERAENPPPRRDEDVEAAEAFGAVVPTPSRRRSRTRRSASMPESSAQPAAHSTLRRPASAVPLVATRAELESVCLQMDSAAAETIPVRAFLRSILAARRPSLRPAEAAVLHVFLGPMPWSPVGMEAAMMPWADDGRDEQWVEAAATSPLALAA